MMGAPGLTFKPVESVAYPQLVETGVWLSVEPYKWADGTASLRVRGLWQCSEEELTMLPNPPHRAVAVLALFGPDLIPFSFSAQREGVVFPDDILASGNQRRGYYDFDLFDQSGHQPRPGSYQLSASFLGRLSEVTAVELS